MVPTLDNDRLREKCAVFGAFGINAAARLTYYGLWALQHRGQESSGIASLDSRRIHRHSAKGLVANVYREEDIEQLPGRIAIGHNRYSTSGGAGDRHSQPIVDYDHKFAFAHNGNLPDCKALEEFLVGRDIDTSLLNDSGMMSAAICSYMDDGLSLAEAVTCSYPLFKGAFSSVAMAPGVLVAFRDHCGIRPLSIAKLGSGYVIASETCAFDTIGAEFIRDVEPGELVVITSDGVRSQQVVKGNQKLDIFEMVYFSRPDSKLLGVSVNEVRKNFGRQLAKEYPIDADVVVPVPDSSIPMAIGYAEESGVPFEMGLVKNRYIHRTFIRPTAELRTRDLMLKLNPLADALRGKRVVLIDDSIVRGSTMRQVAKMLYDVGVKELHLMISSPPVKYPDYYGIDTPKQQDLIAANMTIEQMKEYLGVDSLNFLSYDGMLKATGLPSSKFSTSCFNGKYPIPIGDHVKEIQLV